MVLLIVAPAVKPCEPPAGVARLYSALNRHGIACTVLDAGIEGILQLARNPVRGSDRWTTRARRNLDRNLDSLRSRAGYRNFDAYKRAVADINRLLAMSVADPSIHLSLANYQADGLSPVKSADLVRAFEQPEGNPFFPVFSARLTDIIEKERPFLAGFSLNYLSQALCTFAMAGFISRRFPGIKIVLGGGLVTSWLRSPSWRSPFGGLIDLLVDGPGEHALLSLAGIEASNPDPPLPDYTPFPMKDYLAPGPVVPYSASTGCYWNRCSFCPERAEGNPYVPVPTPKALEHLHTLAGRTRPALVHLLDNAVSPALLNAICTHPFGTPWYGFARITRQFTDPDFCASLKRSGCVMLKLGIESGDQEVIDRENKGIDLDIASAALKTLKRFGIATYVYLLFGTPSEDLESARKTLRFTTSHSQWIDYLNLAIFNLPLNSPDAIGLETSLLYEGDLSLYTGFRHPKGWDRAHVRHFLDREFRRHPAVAPILRRDPPFFTSNHAPFFAMNSPS